jgi:hypothetical protein
MQAPAISLEAFPVPTRHDSAPPVPEATLPSAFAAEAPAASAVPPIPEPAAPPPSWTAELLAVAPSFELRREAARFGMGLGLAALYGLALGARHGRLGFLVHAAGVPSALLVALGVGVPALFIVLALLDAPVAPATVASAASRAAASGGLVLAGLAPAAALFVVTSERAGAAALAGGVGLAVGGAFAFGSVVSEVRKAMAQAQATTRLAADLAFAGFGLFAVLVALRVWVALLPVLRGV